MILYFRVQQAQHHQHFDSLSHHLQQNPTLVSFSSSHSQHQDMNPSFLSHAIFYELSAILQSLSNIISQAAAANSNSNNIVY